MRPITIWCTIALSALCLASCSSDKKENTTAATQEEELPAIHISQVHLQPVEQLGTYTATVEAFKTNNIAPSAPNRIKSILVDVGSQVARGQKVVVMDDVNIDQVKVQLDNYQREYDRALKLLQIGSGTQQSVDQLKAQLDGTRRQYANLVENTSLVSPISGVVTARNYDPGDMSGAQPILTIEQIQPVKITAHISESDFTKVHKGMPVDITLDVYPGEHFKGQVYLIHPSIDPQTRTFTVEITIPNAGDKVLPGMFARATLNYGTIDRIVVPDRAIIKQTGSGNKYVYSYDPKTQTVDFLHVEIGQRIGDAYEIISGIPDGAYVAITGQTHLADGVKVKVLDQPSAAPAPADSTAAAAE